MDVGGGSGGLAITIAKACPGLQATVIDQVLPHCLSPEEVVWQNLMFINSFDQGGARTESERRTWLMDAGFKNIERIMQPDELDVVTAQKPAGRKGDGL